MSSMRWASLGIAAFTASALFFGCSDEDPAATPTDAGTDTSSDTGVDTRVETDSGPGDTAMMEAAIEITFETAEWDKVKTLSPLPAVPADTTNKYADNAAAATLGQMLFFEASYSGALAVGDDGTNGGLGAVGDKGKVACASCHMGETMDDNRSKPGKVSLGTDLGTRNALSIVNSVFYKWTNWGGRFDSQWHLAVTVAENAKIMNSTRLDVAHMLWNKYRTEYDAIFDDKLPTALDPAASDASRFPASGKPGQAAFDGMAAEDKVIVNRIFSNYGKAIAAYQRKLVSRNSPFDKFVAGDKSAIGDDAKRGLKIFIGKGKCLDCHSGPNFADDKFHALVVEPATDMGRFADVPGLLSSIWKVDGDFSDDKTTGKLTGLMAEASMKGQFRTKSLRGVAASGPFMHAGQFTTLEEVVDFYKKGGGEPGDSGIVKSDLMKPIAFEGTEAADLIAFMKTLTGESIPAALKANTAK